MTVPNPNRLADELAEAAETDLALPYSLVQDAWDLLERAQAEIAGLGGAVTRLAFEVALEEALEAYKGHGPGAYRFNPRSLPVTSV